MKTFYSILFFFILEGGLGIPLCSQSIEELLPQDTIAYVSFPAGSEFLQQSQKSAVGQLLQEPEMQHFFSKVFELLNPFLRPVHEGVQQLTGTSLSTLYSSFDGELALALIRVESEVPEILGSLGFVDANSGINLLQTILRNLNLQIEERQNNEFHYQVIPLGPQELYCIWAGSKLLFSFHLNVLQAISQNKFPTPSLKEVPEFQEVSKQIGSQKAFRFWINTKAILQHPAISASLGKNGALLSRLGLTQWTSLIFAFWFHDLDLKTAFQIGTDGSAPQGITKLLNTPALSTKILNRLPKSIYTFSAFQFDFAEFYQQAKSLILEIEPSAWNTVAPYIKMVETDLGSPLESLLSLSGNTYIQVSFNDSIGDQSVWILYPQDMTIWNSRLKKMFERTMTIAEKNYRGKVIYSYRIKPGKLENGLSNFKPIQIFQSVKEVLALPTCYFVDGDRVVGAHMPQILMDFIDGLEPSAQFPAQVMTSLNSGVASLSWEDIRAENATGYYSICDGVSIFLPAISGFAGLETSISSFDFPSAETVFKYRRPGFSYSKTGKNMLWISQLNLIPTSFPQLSSTSLVTGVAITAAIAIPGLLRARISSNETSAIGTLRTLSTSQNQFQNANMKDRDIDGVGEYGFFTELAGTLPVPVGNQEGSPARPTFINSVLGATSLKNGGIAEKSGYYFLLFLPSGSENGPIRENGQPVPPVFSDPMSETESAEINAQETRWCAYAWPVSAGNSGNKAFFINQAGEVCATSNIPMGTSTLYYSGLERIPEHSDIFDQDGSGDIDASILVGTPISNGLIWHPTS